MKQVSVILELFLAALALAQPPRPAVPSIDPTPAEKRQIQMKIDEIAKIVQGPKARQVNGDLVADVEVYAKAGRMLLEFPEDFFTQDGIDHALAALDTGIERARQLQSGQSPWMSEQRETHGYYSALDGSVPPYRVSIPASYDGARPVRLYVWMHGRAARLTESGVSVHLSETRTFEAACGRCGRDSARCVWALERSRLPLCRGSGCVRGAGGGPKALQDRSQPHPVARIFDGRRGRAWNVALHNPDRWAAEEIGAGTWSRRPEMPGLAPSQYAALHIWENMTDWAPERVQYAARRARRGYRYAGLLPSASATRGRRRAANWSPR